jgi:hypothetical protein
MAYREMTTIMAMITSPRTSLMAHKYGEVALGNECVVGLNQLPRFLVLDLVFMCCRRLSVILGTLYRASANLEVILEQENQSASQANVDVSALRVRASCCGCRADR